MLTDLQHFLQTVLIAVGALLPIVDPLGSAPIYMELTGGIEPASRSPLARQVALDCFVLLVACAVIGVYVLDFFGLSIPDVQIAGGLVLSGLGWTLLAGPDGSDRATRSDAASTVTDDWRPTAFFPLTMPVTVGPGSIAVALALGAHHAATFRMSLAMVLADVLGIAIVAAAVYVCYNYADRILRRLGKTGTVVLTRLSAFILLCIGVHIAWDGIQALLASAFPKIS
jgi:multiple antibiotic resistance protein